jgi:hypothetical protein
MESTMRVIYKPFMVKRLQKVIHEAKAKDMEIEKIVLDVAEFEQLKLEVETTSPWLRPLGSFFDKHSDKRTYYPTPLFEIEGVKIEKEESNGRTS